MTSTTSPAVITDARRRRLVLVTVAVALMMVVSAVSGLNVALPSFAVETGATQTQMQWVVDAYTVVFAGLLLFAGAVGDRYGRKGTLLVGLTIFGVAAAAAALASDPGVVIACRAAMGVGAAFTMPTTLSIITTSFPPEERGKAVGLWVGLAGGGAVLGLFASGLLLTWFGWNSFFVLNVLLALAATAGTIAFVPTSVDAHPPVLDWLAAALSLVAVSGLVFGIIEGPVSGWSDPIVVGALVAGAVALVLFVVRELRVPAPLLDPRLFRLRGFGVGSLSLTVQFFAAFGFFFLLMQYLQFVNGFTALGAAAALLPLPFVMIPLARQAPRIADRFGFRRVGAAGLVSMAVGFAVISTLEVELAYPRLLVGLVFFAVGMALAGAPATTAIVRSLPAAKQGVASAVNDTSRELGSALGIAVLGSVLNQGYRDGVASVAAALPSQLSEAVLSSIAFVARVPAGDPRAAAVVDAAKQAFVDGVSNAVLVAAGVLVVAAAVVALRGPGPHHEVEENVDGVL
jgi:EmrB/QacA subfamily drug resistance transporter